MSTATTHHVRRPARESTAERRSLAAPTNPTAPVDDLNAAVAHALAESRAASETAERTLRRAEVARSYAAAALERDLEPLRLDEQARAALRAAYSAADADVAAARSAFESARELESAIARVCAAVSGGGTDAATAVIIAALRATPT